MSSVSNATDAAVIKAFAAIPALLEQTPALIVRGRFLDCECLLGPTDHSFHASIRAGRIVELVPAPVLMRSWRFSYSAQPAAWAEYWKPMPRPGWHDLLALTKRGENPAQQERRRNRPAADARSCCPGAGQTCQIRPPMAVLIDQIRRRPRTAAGECQAQHAMTGIGGDKWALPLSMVAFRDRG
jgi:hypothetical protein